METLLVYPERAKSKLIASIHYSETGVFVTRDYERDSFNETVRHFDYHWSSVARVWERRIKPEFTGQAIDRAAEIGRELLAAGFPVAFPNGPCLRLALDGSYVPEQTRWVMAATGGKYVGWFVLSWARREDFYAKARQLHGSRYDSPSVVVPPESFEEIEDFADQHDFRLSAGARRVIEEQRRLRMEALVVNIEPKPARAPRPAKETTYGVDRELLDDAFTPSK